MVWLPDGEKTLRICLLISTEYTNVTDGRTDGRTDGQLPRDGIGIRPRLCIASCGSKSPTSLSSSPHRLRCYHHYPQHYIITICTIQHGHHHAVGCWSHGGCIVAKQLDASRRWRNCPSSERLWTTRVCYCGLVFVLSLANALATRRFCQIYLIFLFRFIS